MVFSFSCCSGDAFLEPYMQGLSNDVNHTIDEVFDGSSNVFKKRLHDDYMPHDDRMSTFSSPVDSVDTPLDDKGEHFIIEVNAGSQGSLNQVSGNFHTFFLFEGGFVWCKI